LAGTAKEFEIDFVYGVRKHGDGSMALESVPMGVYEVHGDYPGEGSPKAGGVYVVTAGLTKTPCLISFGNNLYGWSERVVSDLQKTEWTFICWRGNEKNTCAVESICFSDDR
jgi:hypothetical protein